MSLPNDSPPTPGRRERPVPAEPPGDRRLDGLTRLARRLFGTPIVVLALSEGDRLRLGSTQGLDSAEVARNVAFVASGLLGSGPTVVPDFAAEPRFAGHPLATRPPHARFLAGSRLRSPAGRAIGALWLVDTAPRAFGAEELGLLQDLVQVAEQQLAAMQLATTDPLTRLENRRGFEARGEQALGLCRRLRRPASVLLFDMDGFKGINDRFGHAEGDRALAEFAGLLRTALRDSDVVGRLGGDEFAAMLTDADAHAARRAAERFRAAVVRRNAQPGPAYPLQFSVGVVEYSPERHPTMQAILEEADARMYGDKRARTAGGGPGGARH